MLPFPGGFGGFITGQSTASSPVSCLLPSFTAAPATTSSAAAPAAGPSSSAWSILSAIFVGDSAPYRSRCLDVGVVHCAPGWIFEENDDEEEADDDDEDQDEDEDEDDDDDDEEGEDEDEENDDEDEDASNSSRLVGVVAWACHACSACHASSSFSKQPTSTSLPSILVRTRHFPRLQLNPLYLDCLCVFSRPLLPQPPPSPSSSHSLSDPSSPHSSLCATLKLLASSRTFVVGRGTLGSLVVIRRFLRSVHESSTYFGSPQCTSRPVGTLSMMISDVGGWICFSVALGLS